MSLESRMGLVNKGWVDERLMDPEIIPVLRAFRDRGVQTMASCSGACSKPAHEGWGAYVELWVVHTVHRDGLIELTDSTTPLLQQRFNRSVELQLVSSLAWHTDSRTTYREIASGDAMMYRLQLAGSFLREEFRSAWQIVRDGI